MLAAKVCSDPPAPVSPASPCTPLGTLVLVTSDLHGSYQVPSSHRFLCHLFLGAIPLELGIHHPDSELC